MGAYSSEFSTYDHPNTYVKLDAIRALSSRALLSILRESGPAEVYDAAIAELDRRPRGSWGRRNTERAALFALGDYYAWAARKGFPAGGNDPRTGRPWEKTPGTLPRKIGRAENIAAAKVAYEAARAYPNPLP